MTGEECNTTLAFFDGGGGIFDMPARGYKFYL